jgi:hypothetical protein
MSVIASIINIKNKSYACRFHSFQCASEMRVSLSQDFPRGALYPQKVYVENTGKFTMHTYQGKRPPKLTDRGP